MRWQLQQYIRGPDFLWVQELHDPWLREYEEPDDEDMSEDGVIDMLGVLMRQEKLEPPFEVRKSLCLRLLTWLCSLESFRY